MCVWWWWGGNSHSTHTRASRIAGKATSYVAPGTHEPGKSLRVWGLPGDGIPQLSISPLYLFLSLLLSILPPSTHFLLPSSIALTPSLSPHLLPFLFNPPFLIPPPPPPPPPPSSLLCNEIEESHLHGMLLTQHNTHGQEPQQRRAEQHLV